MNKLSPRLLCQIYVLFVLLAVITLSTLPYALLALVLLLVMLLITWRPPPPRLSVVITVSAIFLMPLVLEPPLNYFTYAMGVSLRAVPIAAATLILPIIYLLDYNLRQNTPKIAAFIGGNAKGRHITTVFKALFASLLTMLLVSLVINNPTLLFTGIIFALYLLGTMIRVLLALPRNPLDVSTLGKRVIAGTTAGISLYASNKSSMSLHGLLSSADPWVKVTPQRFTLSRDKIKMDLNITPPLAGPSLPQLRVSFIDPWGLIQVNQLLQPVALHVIPRAKYAEWLALKYLEQSGDGAMAFTEPLSKAIRAPKRGIEYAESRTYQPGDQLKNIDWKHTLKLNKLIVKEFIETGRQAAIIAVNLSVTDAEEADKIAFNLITTALTLAQETIPTALAVYNHQRVVVTTAVLDPREMLKQTLLLVKDITSVELTQRLLQLPELSKLKRDITQLKRATSEPAQRLLSLLDFEYQAIEKAAKNHPATLALSSVAEQTSSPATIVLISQLNHDAEALLVTTEKLSRREFTTLPIATK